jgi:Tol biopolymer transport system component
MGMTLSPSGGRAAVWKSDAARNIDIWDVDLASGIRLRMTTDPGSDSDAAWSPDSSRMAFSSNRTGLSAVYLKEIASGREELISQPDGLNTVVDGWTPDGRSLVVRNTQTANATYLVSVDGERTARLLGKNQFLKDEHEVSPDGRWVAFNSNESGEWEVYVATFPAHAAKRRVSSAGGVQPHWRGDGRELFYLARDSSIMSVPIAPGPGLETGRPVVLFSTDIETNPILPQYGVTRDGQRFLGLSRGKPQPEQLRVLLNWLTPAHLGRR